MNSGIPGGEGGDHIHALHLTPAREFLPPGGLGTPFAGRMAPSQVRPGHRFGVVGRTAKPQVVEACCGPKARELYGDCKKRRSSGPGRADSHLADVRRAEAPYDREGLASGRLIDPGRPSDAEICGRCFAPRSKTLDRRGPQALSGLVSRQVARTTDRSVYGAEAAAGKSRIRPFPGLGRSRGLGARQEFGFRTSASELDCCLARRAALARQRARRATSPRDAGYGEGARGSRYPRFAGGSIPAMESLAELGRPAGYARSIPIEYKRVG